MKCLTAIVGIITNNTKQPEHQQPQFDHPTVVGENTKQRPRMKHLLLLFVILNGVEGLHAQEDTAYHGIKFEQSLTWPQILARAKAENKYIFVDCYATWCGPCKRMDKEVYPLKQVGDYYNSRFISVKLQMDRTKKDNEQVKNWYPVADNMSNEYKITAYPSYLFFAPDGRLVHEDIGFTETDKLLAIAKLATTPGHVYNDPYAAYERLIIEFRSGQKSYTQMPYLVEMAKKLGKIKLADSLITDYYQYLTELKRKEFFTKSNIEFIATNIKKTDDIFFKLFYPYGKKIDMLMDKKKFSRFVVQKVIEAEFITPVLNKFYKQLNLKENNTGQLPDWDSISNLVTARLNTQFASRAVRAAKAKFYWSSNDEPNYIKTFSIQLQNHDLDTSDKDVCTYMNDCAWRIFVGYTDERLINYAIKWMERLLKTYKHQYSAGYIDTYANLLYKYSILFHKDDRIEEAINYEERAAKMAYDYAIEKNKPFFNQEGDEFRKTAEKMKQREPTWRVPKDQKVSK